MHKMPLGREFTEATLELARAIESFEHAHKRIINAAEHIQGLYDQQGLAYQHIAAMESGVDEKARNRRCAEYSFKYMKKYEAMADHLKAMQTIFKSLPVKHGAE